MKNERVRTCKAFLAMVHHHSIAMLDRIVTMEKFEVSFTPPRPSSRARSDWERASLAPSRPKRSQQDQENGIGFLLPQGLHLQPTICPGDTVNTNYIMDVQGKFLKVFKQKRLVMAARDWWFRDNVPMHTPAMVTDWMATGDPTLTLFVRSHTGLLRAKRELGDLTLTQETFKRAIRTLSASRLSVLQY
jgi:hypothetical protein